MSHDPFIDNVDFKFGETDFEAIRAYLALTEAKEAEIARMAAELAPKASGKFDAAALVEKACRLDIAAREDFKAERGRLISKMNLNSLLRLHASLHGKGDRDYVAERHPERLCNPLAGPLAKRMQDVAEVRDLIRAQKSAEVEKWEKEFTKAAKGSSSISLSVALKIVFPRTKNATEYFEEYCKINGDPFDGGHASLIPGLTKPRSITSTCFPEFASKLHAAYEENKDAWIKKAQRAGGRKGGTKSAALREKAANQAAASNLEAMPGEIIERTKKPMRKNQS
jgi:hypothetical protein